MPATRLQPHELRSFIRKHHETPEGIKRIEALGERRSTIYRIAKELGIRLILGGGRANPEIMNERIAWIKKYGKGMYIQDIADALEISYTAAHNAVERSGVKVLLKKPPTRRTPADKPSRVFNVHSRENWLI